MRFECAALLTAVAVKKAENEEIAKLYKDEPP